MGSCVCRPAEHRDQYIEDIDARVHLPYTFSPAFSHLPPKEESEPENFRQASDNYLSSPQGRSQADENATCAYHHLAVYYQVQRLQLPYYQTLESRGRRLLGHVWKRKTCKSGIQVSKCPLHLRCESILTCGVIILSIECNIRALFFPFWFQLLLQ